MGNLEGLKLDLAGPRRERDYLDDFADRAPNVNGDTVARRQEYAEYVRGLGKDELDQMIEDLETKTNQDAEALRNAGRDPEQIQREAISESPVEAPETGEQETGYEDEEEISPARLIEITKNSRSFKKFINNATRVAAGAVLAAAILVGGLAIDINGKNDNTGPTAPTFTGGSVAVERMVENNAGDTGEVKEAIGIDDMSYFGEGMWCSDTKPNTVAFTDFQKLVEKHEGNVVEAIKEACTQVETKSDYIAALPDRLRPAGFEGLSELEVNEKLESLSPEEFDKVSEEFNETMDKAKVRSTTLNGKYTNAYMAIRDGEDLVGSKVAQEKGLAINHENMELIACTTNEKGTDAYELYWDGGDGGGGEDVITVKGNCDQVVEKYDENSKRFEGIEEAVEESLSGGGPITIVVPPPKPTPTPPGPPVTPPPGPPVTPTPTPKPKDAENLKRIDNNILNDIANDIDTGQVVVTPNPGVSPDNLTDNGFISQQDTVTNTDTEDTETVQPINENNNYSNNNGPANPTSEKAVRDDSSGQAEADSHENTSPPTSGNDLKSALSDLGID